MNRSEELQIRGSTLGKGRVNGFTLIELLITIVIIAILATIAFASYDFAVTKSRRSAAANCLQERAQFMERYYTTNMTYLGAPVPAQCETDLQPFYTVSFVAAPTATAYTLRAVPQGAQLGDTLCGTLTLTQQGVRGESGTAATADECW